MSAKIKFTLKVTAMEFEKKLLADNTSKSMNNNKSMHAPQENIKQKTDKLEEILADLKVILDSENTELREQAIGVLINKRLSELQNESAEKQERISLAGNRIEGNFINSETEIKRNIIFDCFKLNDPEIYKYLLNRFYKLYKSWNKPKLRDIVGHSIIYALGDYFGNYINTEETENSNKEFYMDHTTFDSEIINLEELKGKNLAVCAEKATVTHNYLKFLGVDSHVVFSNNCQLNDSNDGHAYVIFISKNGKFIFDPTNPILVENADGKINSINPALYKISDEDYNHLLIRDGQQVSVQHINQTLDQTNYIDHSPQVRIYG